MATYFQRYDPLIRAANPTDAIAAFNSLETTIAAELSISLADASAIILRDVGVLLKDYSQREQIRMHAWIGARGPHQDVDFPEAAAGLDAAASQAGVDYTHLTPGLI